MPLPELIGRYRPVRRLGAGGFAVVWLAHDESLDAEVAVKVMADNWADRLDLRERFLREARMLRQASSYRIVQVFDIGELTDGRPYLVMEYADRGTLAERVKDNGAYPLATALRLTAEVARGVAELHSAGVVHRDLKPSNVLITSVRGGGERLLVADLGVAKSLAHGSGVTMSVGSAGYMAPEQMEPQIGVDVRADVYSLGAFAYHLMTAEKPAISLVLRERLPANLPPAVRDTLLSTLQGERENRWPDAASLAERFDELASQIDDDVTVAASAPRADLASGSLPAAGASAYPVPPVSPVSPTPGWQYQGPETPQPASSWARNSHTSNQPQNSYDASVPAPPAQFHQQPWAPQGYQDTPASAVHPADSYQQAPQGHQQGPQHYGQPQGAPERSPGFQSSETGPVSASGRGRWIATMLAVVVLAAGTGVGGVKLWQQYRDRETYAADDTSTVSLTAPRVYGTNQVGTGWNPAAIGLDGEDDQPGLLLSDNVPGWYDLNADVNGVFIGVSPSRSLPAKVKAITHDNCEDVATAPVSGSTVWSGEVHTWGDCADGSWVKEVYLKPADGGSDYVYMQVRQTADNDRSVDELVSTLGVTRDQ
ncbi:serine/threonine-protein kinase [Kineosporia succinea]|uniref:non-specific serine/threonine protein kinase n=1 Tax=Kineosporia succinea TaxID=84632 RepID=A0ABT9P0G3_9ACTN|nr:serine/threonine-protein kinase [Kineosporia succinea]MDP9826162.1 serine/threonine protein kinase [Kineosporia succinea]